MGFGADCATHWRWIGAELRQGCSRFVHAPFHSLCHRMAGPLLLSFVWFLVTLYFNNVLSITAERQGNRLDPTLPDEGHEELGDQIHEFHLPDYMLYALLCTTAFRFLPIWPCVKPAMWWMIVRRWFFLEGVIFFLRGFSVAMTGVPQPNPTCVTTATGSVWSEGIYIAFGIHHTCGDCMFSGHTAATTLLVMMWTHYSRGEELAICFGPCRGVLTSNVDAAGDPMGWKLFDLVLWAYAIVVYWVILVTRFHYSNDVFVGFFTTYFLFKAYHFYVKALATRQGSFFSRFMRWFEGINLAQENLQKEQDLETGGAIMGATTATGTTGMGVGDGNNDPRARPSCTHVHRHGRRRGDATYDPNAACGAAVFAQALALGQEATKDNVIWTGADNAPPALLLPVSYLEGREYYRAGAPDSAASLRLGLPLNEQQHMATTTTTNNNHHNKHDSQTQGLTHDKDEGSVQLRQPGDPVPYESQTEMAAMAPVRVHTGGQAMGAGSVEDLGPEAAPPQHNFQQPAPVLAPGEHAQQELREVEREHGVRLT